MQKMFSGFDRELMPTCRRRASLNLVCQRPEKEKFKAMATPTVGSTAAEFAQLIDTETKKWGDVGRAANVKLG